MDIQPAGPFGPNPLAAGLPAAADSGNFAAILSIGAGAVVPTRIAPVTTGPGTLPTQAPPLESQAAASAPLPQAGKPITMGLLLAGAATTTPPMVTAPVIPSAPGDSTHAVSLVSTPKHLVEAEASSPGEVDTADPSPDSEDPSAAVDAQLPALLPEPARRSAIQAPAANPPSGLQPAMQREAATATPAAAPEPAPDRQGEKVAGEPRPRLQPPTADLAAVLLPVEAQPGPAAQDQAQPLPQTLAVHDSAAAVVTAELVSTAVASGDNALKSAAGAGSKADGASAETVPVNEAPARVRSSHQVIGSADQALGTVGRASSEEGQAGAGTAAASRESFEPTKEISFGDRADPRASADKAQAPLQAPEGAARAAPAPPVDRPMPAPALQPTAPAPAGPAPAPVAPSPAAADAAAQGAAPDDQPVLEARAGQLGREMGVEIARRISAGLEELVIRLDPAELGRISIRMSLNDQGSLRAVLAAEAPAALDVLRHEAADLGRALEQAGVRTDSDSLRFDRGSGGDNGSAWHRYQGQERNPRPGGAATAAADEPEQTNVRTSGRVNLMA